MRKCMDAAQKFICILLVIVLAGLPIFFVAELTKVAASATTPPTVTFENIRENVPSLYIMKTADSTDPRYQVPADVRFSFVIKLDNELVYETEYVVFDAEGRQVYKYNGVESTDASGSGKEPHLTSSNGDFTLLAGQTAVFEYVGAGVSYEIRELPAENFMQSEPEGGLPAVGTVLQTGAQVRFHNRYIPPVETGSELSSLTIIKDAVYPSGYEVPENPEFVFTLHLAGKVYSYESYTVIDTKSGTIKKDEEVTGRVRTDENGNFKIKVGETVVFADVPVGVDYLIEEKETDGWHVVGNAKREGATTSAGNIISFTNASASFGVTKTMQDLAKPDIDFTFRIKDAENLAFYDLKYYLYTTDGKLIDQTVRYTGRTGDFVLKPGQTAIFFDVPIGTRYTVSEDVSPSYQQRVPLQADGYKGKTVTDTVEILPFVNEELPETTVLTVSKLITSQVAETAPDGDTFTFVLRKKTDAGYQPVNGAVYSITVGSNTSTYKTDASGSFQLKQNETARFETLKKDVEYQVEEVLTSDKYHIDEAIKNDVLKTELHFKFTNVYRPRPVNLYIHKKNTDGQPLEGASFDLYTDKDLKNKINTSSPVTDSEGKLVFHDIDQGQYYLVESKSPKGYKLLDKPVALDIMRGRNGWYIAVLGKEYYDTDSQKAYYVVPDTEEKNAEGHVTIINHEGFRVPLAGGEGIILFVIGILIALLLGGGFIIRSRKQNRSKVRNRISDRNKISNRNRISNRDRNDRL